MTENSQVSTTCSVEDCPRKVLCRGMCRRHYRRWRRDSDEPRLGGRKVGVGQADPDGDWSKRYWSQIDVRGSGDCWPWLGGIGNGYGHMSINGRRRPAHQIAWEIANEQAFPPGWVADHTCHNADKSCPGGRTQCMHRRCQNPAHIEAVLSEENSSRGQQGRKHPHPRGPQ